jgi:phosphatidylglycerol---prolipoprotein diacylglyceryl transferase
MFSFTFPSPTAFFLGSWPVRWYGLAYAFGLLGAWRWALWTARLIPGITRKNLDDFLPWAFAGIIIGGRLGHVLFYDLSYYLIHPWEIFYLWQGGMAFHGAVLGCTLSAGLYCHKNHILFRSFTDCWVCGVPIGLFLGRLANFINQELYGKTTNVSWAIIFPAGDPLHLPRHPSQLYEGILEGVLLWGLLFILSTRTSAPKKPGTLTGFFLTGYAIARMIGECFREIEPSALQGFLDQNLNQPLTQILLSGFMTVEGVHQKPFYWVTSGQILSWPLIFWGIFFMYTASRSTITKGNGN